MNTRRSDAKPLSEQNRYTAKSDIDINYILVNGAQISLRKLSRAGSFNARLYYYAEIGVYLEVSLSSGAGITDETRQLLQEVHKQATYLHMEANKLKNLKPSED